MTTVKELKDLGLIPIIGDKYTFIDHKNVEAFKSIVGIDESWAGQLKTDRGIYDDDQLGLLTPLSFAWRPLNTLPDNPKFKYEVGFDNHGWRPLLDQSAVNTSDDKPVFTQEMADADYVPEAGCYCEIMLDGYWQKCFIVGMSKKGNPVIELGEHCTESIGCNYRALDTRTPKQKAVDELAGLISSKGGLDGELFGVSVLSGIIINAGYRKC